MPSHFVHSNYIHTHTRIHTHTVGLSFRFINTHTHTHTRGCTRVTRVSVHLPNPHARQTPVHFSYPSAPITWPPPSLPSSFPPPRPPHAPSSPRPLPLTCSFTVEMLPPTKADVLAHIDGGGPAPPRRAQAVMFLYNHTDGPQCLRVRAGPCMYPSLLQAQPRHEVCRYELD